MNQTEYEDRCSKCGQPVTRLLRERGPPRIHERFLMRKGGPGKAYAAGHAFETSCCAAPPLAVPVVKET